MAELEDHFIDKLVVTNRPLERNHLRIRRHLWDEMLRVEFPKLFSSDASGQHRNMVDIGILDHSGESLFSIMRGKLVTHVFLPEITEDLLRGRQFCIGM